MPNNNQELRNKLHQKLKEKRLERTSKVIRNNRLEQLEEKLIKTKSPAERKKIKEEIKLLETIEEKEINNAGEFAEYSDNASFGGGFEHPN